MRMTITVEDAGAAPAQVPAEQPAAEPAAAPVDAGAARTHALESATADAPGPDDVDDGGQAPTWLVDLLDGLGTPDGHGTVGADAGSDAGAAPAG